MSFTLYFQGMDDPLTERELFAAFEGYITPDDFGGTIHYDEQNGAELYCRFDESRTTDSFSINRPCADDRLAEALFGLLLGRLWLMTYPAEELACVVASEAAAAKVREQFAEEAPDLVAGLRLCQGPAELMQFD